LLPSKRNGLLECSRSCRLLRGFVFDPNSAHMMKHQRSLQVLRFECRLLAVVWRSQNCFLSRVCLAIGIGYWIAPWQLIPDSVPVFGYSDNVMFVLIGLVAARLLIPPRLEHRLARQLGGGDEMTMRVAAIRSELATHWLVGRRRTLRCGAHLLNVARKIRSRMTLALSAHTPAGLPFVILGYRFWWLIRKPFAARRSACRSIVVVGGAPRSGTTLLRTLLGRHPMIASGPETTVFLRRISSPQDIGQRLGWNPALIATWQRESRSQVEFIERFQRAILEQSGKAIWVEKTPRNAGRFRFVRRNFPHAKLVHIVRDGRDVVCSLRRTPFAKLDHAPAESVVAAQRCAVQWRASVRAALRFRRDPGYYELRYEDLVRDPEKTLRALIDFLGLAWSDGVLVPLRRCVDESDSNVVDDPDAITAAGEIFASSIGRWRQDLTYADCKVLRLLIGPLLVELGYEDGVTWGLARPP
jgi:protein-tyrosine sulfotransferase